MSALSKKAATRLLLIETAVQLYAKHGLGGVSLRQIGTNAGARNSAVMHYHFKDKLGLIDACAERVCEQLQLAGAEPGYGPAACLDVLVEREVKAWVYLAQLPAWGQAGVKLVSRLLLEREPAIRAIVNRRFGEHALKFRDQLQALYPQIEAEVVSMRARLALDTIVHTTAEIEVMRASPFRDVDALDVDVAWHQLIRYVVQGLQFNG